MKRSVESFDGDPDCKTKAADHRDLEDWLIEEKKKNKLFKWTVIRRYENLMLQHTI